MNLYNMKRTPDGYRMVKWDQYLNIEGIYTIIYRRGRHYCDCPQGQKSYTCKHREMIPLFASSKAIDSGKFYCQETGQFTQEVCYGEESSRTKAREGSDQRGKRKCQAF